MIKSLLREVRCPKCDRLLGKCCGITQIKCPRCKELRTMTTLAFNVKEVNYHD